MAGGLDSPPPPEGMHEYGGVPMVAPQPGELARNDGKRHQWLPGYYVPLNLAEQADMRSNAVPRTLLEMRLLETCDAYRRDLDRLTAGAPGVPAMRDEFRTMYERDPQGFKEAALSQLQPDLIWVIRQGLRGDPPFRKPERWAARMAAEALKWIGAQTQVAILIQQAVGTTPEAAKQAVSVVKNARGMDEDERVALCENYLLQIYRANPIKAAASALSSIFSRLEVRNG